MIRRSDSPSWLGTQHILAHRLAASLAILLVPLFSGCVNSSLAAARSRLAQRQYAAAHQDLLAAAREPQKLSTSERREVLDGLCLTEFEIGGPSYPLAEQQRACAQAAGEPGSISGSRLAQIEQAQRLILVAEVTGALRASDVARAENAIARYQSIPGAEPRAIVAWSKQIWRIVNQQDRLAQKRSGRRLDVAISELARKYPRMRTMNESSFRHWILNNASVDDARMVSNLKMRRDTVDFWVPDTSLSTVALNLNRFARINDALVARCRCGGRTNIAVAGTGLPAYLLRLDPETHRSEVLILPQPQYARPDQQSGSTETLRFRTSLSDQMRNLN